MSDKTQDPTALPILDIVIVGAGPNALALAARLAEKQPAALYTDLEHARLSWLRKEEGSRKAERRRKTVKNFRQASRFIAPRPALAAAGGLAMRVIDDMGSEWMTKWNRYFKCLCIPHLRSPMFFHPSPADNDALVAFARESGREDELDPITGVVGKEFTKHARKRGLMIGRDALVNERSREDYFRPSSDLYTCFCQEAVVTRYGLDGLVQQGRVTSVEYGPFAGSEADHVFRIHSTDSLGAITVALSKTVVFAVGAANAPNIPIPFRLALNDEPDARGAWCHSGAFANEAFQFPSAKICSKITAQLPTSMVVVGGGLTSAQICDLALQKGVTKVTLICRGPLKVRSFDFGLEWVTKFSNLNKMSFWQEEDLAERLKQVREARSGGSVNPPFHRILKQHEKSGYLDILSYTSISKAHFDSDGQKWRLELSTLAPNKVLDEKLASPRAPTLSELVDVDYVVCATGPAIAFDTLPCAQSLLASHPIEIIDGYPAITSDLQWNETLPAFVMGAYATLQLGPDAGNLGGTRAGAERVAHRLGELVELATPTGPGAQSQSARNLQKESRSGGRDNYFGMLHNSESDQEDASEAVQV